MSVERLTYLRCDRCGGATSRPSLTLPLARHIARQGGWVLWARAGGADVCPGCVHWGRETTERRQVAR